MWKTNCLGPECGNLVLVPNAGALETRCPACSSDLTVATEPFTEQDWLTCNDPYPMLQFARQHTSDRKLWLFCYASARRYLDPLVAALDRAERHAGEADPAKDAYIEALGVDIVSRFLNGGSGEEWVYRGDLDPYQMSRAVIGRPGGWDPDEVGAHLALLCDVVGNPFRKARLSRTVLNWDGKAVPKLAQSIFDERCFSDLSILADALEEAGCTDAAILGHLRGPGPHVRGCWVVDLCLGLS